MTKTLTQDALRELFHYAPGTGAFTAKTRRGNCVQIGDVAGHVNKKGYRVIKVLGVAHKAHRLAIFYVTGAWPPNAVDHINGDKDDNRFANLRCADDYINAQNKRDGIKGSKSGLIGAHRGAWKGRKWVSEIQHNGQRTYLGIFQTAEAAHLAYVEAKRQLHQGCTI